MDRTYDIVIIGSGPAGLTAGLYTSRARLHTLALERGTPGGQMVNAELIQNYPGFANGVSGSALGSQMLTQAMNFGMKFRLTEVVGIELDGMYKSVKTSEGDYMSKAIIISGGARHKKLGVPGEEEFLGNGVAHCALCDGSRFTGQVVAVAGGGDSGISEGLYLAKLASKVIVIELKPKLGATAILQERAFANSKVEVRCGTKIEAIVGDTKVRSLKLLDIENRRESNLDVDGVFIDVGLDPNTEYLNGQIPLDSDGQILVNDKMETQVSGVFAAGDIRHNSARQVVTAVGDGAMAGLSAEKFVMEQGSEWN